MSPRARRRVLAACILASSMAFIDGSALTVAAPSISNEFRMSFAALQWVFNAYGLALAGLTMAGGALADHYGRARILGIGVAGFVLASIACATSTSPAALIGARFVQGVAAALLTPASLALIAAIYPKAERGAAIGAWAAASALTTAGGPMLGGWLTDTLSWRWIFWINAPIAVASILLLLRHAPREATSGLEFDFQGAALLTVTLTAFALALASLSGGEGAADAATRPAALGGAGAIGILIGVVGAAAFWRRLKSAPHPIAPPALLAAPAFVRINAATFCLYAGLSVLFFLLPFELIDRRGFDATLAGAAFLPFTLAVGLLSQAFGRLADRFGANLLIAAGAGVSALSFIWFAMTQEAGAIAGVAAPMALLGLAFALLVAPLSAAALGAASEADQGVASGVNNTVSRIAQMSGVGVAAALIGYPGGFQIGLAAAAILAMAAATAALPNRTRAAG